MDIHLGRKQTTEFSLGLGEGVVLQLTKDLERLFYLVYFGNFFNSPKLIEKLFQKGIYSIGTVRAKRKQMSKIIDDRLMKREDYVFIFSDNTMAWKWVDNRSVLLLSSDLEGMNDILSGQMRGKGSKTKSSFPYPKAVKLYNSGMGGVDLCPKGSHLGVHIICTIYIFAKMLWFFVWFLNISKASLNFLHI